jgi:hypothetical protein
MIDTNIRAGHPRTADEMVYIAQGNGAELLRVEGTSRAAGGVTLIIRVHGQALGYGHYGQQRGIEDLPVCYRLVYDSTDDPALRGVVDCPQSSPLPTASIPGLPVGIKDTLRRMLLPGADEATVRRVVEQLPLDPAIIREVSTRNGAVGVSLHVGQYDCVMARVTSTVDIWSPQRVQLEPGELKCGADEAAVGDGATPRH